jgi:hypothetical protein
MRFFHTLCTRYFPRAIDNLGLDQGLFNGPKPKLLMVEDIAGKFCCINDYIIAKHLTSFTLSLSRRAHILELTVMLLGHQRSETGRIDFGSEQVWWGFDLSALTIKLHNAHSSRLVLVRVPLLEQNYALICAVFQPRSIPSVA